MNKRAVKRRIYRITALLLRSWLDGDFDDKSDCNGISEDDVTAAGEELVAELLRRAGPRVERDHDGK